MSLSGIDLENPAFLPSAFAFFRREISLRRPSIISFGKSSKTLKAVPRSLNKAWRKTLSLSGYRRNRTIMGRILPVRTTPSRCSLWNSIFSTPCICNCTVNVTEHSTEPNFSKYFFFNCRVYDLKYYHLLKILSQNIENWPRYCWKTFWLPCLLRAKVCYD